MARELHSINMTPLRKELIEWCGYVFDDQNNRWWRPDSKVLLRFYPDSNIWEALLITVEGQENSVICIVESFGHLIALCLAIDGDTYPLMIKIPS